MIPARQLPMVVKQVLRHRTRSLLTAGGVAIAMFLMCAVEAMRGGVARVTQQSAADTRLIVYRKDRYCPFASQLPQSYAPRIAALPGVAAVLPLRIVVTNCRTSLDVVTFRGVPAEQFIAEYGSAATVIEGSFDSWKSRGDAVLLGETLARRRGLRVGDRFSAAGVTVSVAGVIRSDDPEHQNVAYVPLEFLQFASGSRAGGIVTQFDVRVRDAADLSRVAAAIDAEFRADAAPTTTRARQAFIAQAAADVMELVEFARWMGWGCLIGILALVGNAIVLAVQDRVREHAVLATLGFRDRQIAGLVMAEGALLSIAGGVAGGLACAAVARWGQFSLSIEGWSMPIQVGVMDLLRALAIAAALGIAAGLIPAWQAARRDIVESFRTA